MLSTEEPSLTLGLYVIDYFWNYGLQEKASYINILKMELEI